MVDINVVAVLVAVVANFFLGFIWYTPLFGKTWATEMGFDPNEKPAGGVMAKGMILMVVGNFLTAWVLAHNMAAWGKVMPDGSAMSMALSAAFFTWMGFFLPVQLGTMAWEKRSFKLFSINAGYQLVALLVVALVLAHMK